MKIIALSVLGILFFLPTAFSQFYYKDLYSNGQLLSTLARYKENKVRKVDVKSFEDDGTESVGFFCEKKLNKDYTRVELFTRSDMTPASLFTSVFSKEGLLLSTTDSSTLSVVKTNYEYTADGKLEKIATFMQSMDDDFATTESEQHIYQYSASGLPERMFLVNNLDTTLILFAADEDGNIATEMNTKDDSYYYYYYDKKNRLTDIALSNELRPRPTPQYIFQYNNQGQLSQMTAVEEGNKDFTVWKYQYNNGMVVSEKCYGKKGTKLLGSVEYDYK